MSWRWGADRSRRARAGFIAGVDQFWAVCDGCERVYQLQGTNMKHVRHELRVEGWELLEMGGAVNGRDDLHACAQPECSAAMRLRVLPREP